MKILVLDGDVNACVASVRCLGQAGHQVWVGAPQKRSMAGWSHWCRGTFVYPAPELDAGRFAASIAREAAKQPGTMVLPVQEATTLACSAYRDRIAGAGARMVLPSHESLLRAHDKHETTALAKSVGIKVPESRLISDLDEAAAAAASLPYPVVLKARTSEEMSADGTIPVTSRPMYAGNPADFLHCYRAMRSRASDVLVQEFVQGQGAGYFALLHDGELRAEFAHLRLREVNPTGSGSSLRVSVPPSAAIRDGSLAMLRALNYEGAAMVEYRIREDGVPVFLEINPRIWNSLALAVYAGVPFPALLAQIAEFGDVAPHPGYRTGVRCRWLWGDCRHLVSVFRGKPPGFPGKFPDRWGSLWSFLRPVAGTYHDNFMLSDPLPELFDWLYSIRRFRERRNSTFPAEAAWHRKRAAPAN